MAILPFGYVTNAAKLALDHMIDGGPIVEAFVRRYSHDPIDVTAMSPLPTMLDTGAAANVVEKSIVAAMGLTPIDTDYIDGIAGRVRVDYFTLQLIIPRLNYARPGRFAALDLQGQKRPFAMLLGRQFLSRFKLTIDGPLGVGQLEG